MSRRTKRKGTAGRRRTRRKQVSPLKDWWRRLKRRIKRRFRQKRLVVVALVIGLLAVTFLFQQVKSLRKDRVTVASSIYNGIDVSKHQGKINWQRVAEDKKIQFVYIKATEGASLVDKTYRRNITEARKNGLMVGSYHFFTSYKTPEDQYKNFKRQVKKSEQDLIPMVDVEEAGNRYAKRDVLQQRLWTFMNLVKADYGKYPILYSQYKFYNDMLAPDFNKCFIFIARYGNAEPTLRGGGKYNVWQFTERGKVEGIKGYVDLDLFSNGTTLDDILLR